MGGGRVSQITAPTIVVRCYRWPWKAAYLTADEASLALREDFAKGCWAPTLVAYPCWGGNIEHWHLGRVREDTWEA